MKSVKYDNIPVSIVKAWSKDGKSVAAVDRSGVKDINPEDAFSEDIILDISRKDYDDNVSEVLEIIGDFPLNPGEMKNEVALQTASYLFSSIIYAARCGMYRVVDTYYDEKNPVSNYSEYLEKIGTRRASELCNDVSMAVFLSSYFSDLKLDFVYTPEGSEFVIGDNPVFLLNTMVSNLRYFLYLHGLVMIMPLSPSSAVCLYDSSALKFRKTKGRIILTENDVDKINAYIINSSSRVVVSDAEKYGPDYFSHMLDEVCMNSVESELESIRILAQSIEFEENSFRPFADILKRYDDSIFDLKDKVSFNESVLLDRLDFIKSHFLSPDEDDRKIQLFL